jgi:hypothetical protein
MVKFGGSDAQWNRDMNDGWCRNEFKEGFHSDVVMRLREYTTGDVFEDMLYRIHIFVYTIRRLLFCKSISP